MIYAIHVYQGNRDSTEDLSSNSEFESEYLNWNEFSYNNY